MEGYEPVIVGPVQRGRAIRVVVPSAPTEPTEPVRERPSGTALQPAPALLQRPARPRRAVAGLQAITEKAQQPAQDWRAHREEQPDPQPPEQEHPHDDHPIFRLGGIGAVPLRQLPAVPPAAPKPARGSLTGGDVTRPRAADGLRW